MSNTTPAPAVPAPKSQINFQCQPSNQWEEKRDPNAHKIKHGLSDSPTYRSWKSMRNRCYRASDNGFSNYGGRGIKVCDRWRDSFSNFLEDMGVRPKGTTIDRISSNGDYTPDNCRWATRCQQNRNRKSVRLNPESVAKIRLLYSKGEKVVNIAAALGVPYYIVSDVVRGATWKNVGFPEAILAAPKGALI